MLRILFTLNVVSFNVFVSAKAVCELRMLVWVLSITPAKVSAQRFSASAKMIKSSSFFIILRIL